MYLRVSERFKEPEELLPCSKMSSPGAYPEPKESSPYHSILRIPLRAILISSSRLCLFFQSSPFSSHLSTKTLYECLLYALPI
jgi:hypothetical protein